jgi:fructokinase
MEAQYEFYRGADRAFTAEGLIAALPPQLDVFQIGGFCPIEPVDATAWLRVATEARKRGAVLSIDPNVRPSLVDDFPAYRQRLDAFLDLVHLVKVSSEDLEALDPGRSIEAHAEALLARPCCELVVVTQGDRGSRAFTAAGSATAGVYSPPVFGDTVGAGDSLMAGILTLLSERGDLVPGRLGALGDEALASMLRFGAVVAGLNCGQKGCNPPTRAEVDAVLAKP